MGLGSLRHAWTWLTDERQVYCPPEQVRAFARCVTCQRIFPHWWAVMRGEEAKKRGHIGCACGAIRLQPCRIHAWQAVWWFWVVGWFWRGVVRRKANWDPRIPVLERELV